MIFNSASIRSQISTLEKSNAAITEEINQLYAEIHPLKDSRSANNRLIQQLKQQINTERKNIVIP